MPTEGLALSLTRAVRPLRGGGGRRRAAGQAQGRGGPRTRARARARTAEGVSGGDDAPPRPPPRMYKQLLLDAARRSGDDVASVGAGGLGAAGASAARVVASATVRNPACGDQVRFDVRAARAGRGSEGWLVDAAWHDPRGCVLCQASSQLLRENAVGMNLRDLADAVKAAGPELDGTPGVERPGDDDARGRWAPFRLFHDCGAVGSGRKACATLALEAAAQAAREALDSVHAMEDHPRAGTEGPIGD